MAASIQSIERAAAILRLLSGRNRRLGVAQLAGVSIEYYSRLERGDLRGASESVLTALADALRLDRAEREHLFDLARTAERSPLRSRRRAPAAVRPSMRLAVESITSAPASAAPSITAFAIEGDESRMSRPTAILAGSNCCT